MKKLFIDSSLRPDLITRIISADTEDLSISVSSTQKEGKEMKDGKESKDGKEHKEGTDRISNLTHPTQDERPYV